MPRYLDIDRLDAIDTHAFRSTSPYPWANPEGLLTAEGYRALLTNMPDISMFERKFGKQRRGDQAPHDRYSLEYTEGMAVPEPWQDFIDELRGDLYRRTIARLFDAKEPEFRFHWHYTPPGCSVSPHCDSRREHGSHIWYFNPEDEWDPSWGGDTLVLDDGGRFSPHSAPAFEDFERIIPCRSEGNRSAILERSERGWHGVKEITCPEGHMRKVFIVVVNPSSLYWRVRDRLMGKEVQRL
ncbi:MAG TPA: hypothetical protein VFV80_04895 [Geminicoccaceae bacterium]|nr:hypothetical protein [Geminicoccaceae bacterium]